MSVIAKLYFDGGERTLLSYNFQANKSLGSNGRPTFLKEMVFNVSFYPEKVMNSFTVGYSIKVKNLSG